MKAKLLYYGFLFAVQTLSPEEAIRYAAFALIVIPLTLRVAYTLSPHDERGDDE